MKKKVVTLFTMQEDKIHASYTKEKYSETVIEDSEELLKMFKESYDNGKNVIPILNILNNYSVLDIVENIPDFRDKSLIYIIDLYLKQMEIDVEEDN